MHIILTKASFFLLLLNGYSPKLFYSPPFVQPLEKIKRSPPKSQPCYSCGIGDILNSFPVDERGTVKTVVQYFQEQYGFVIQHTTWPCLQVGNQQRINYLPMEVRTLLNSFLVTCYA